MKLSQFTFQQSAKMIMEAYEMGEGYINVPHLSEHEIDPETGEPLDEVPPPYIGHGWFAKRLDRIGYNERIDINHLIETCPLDEGKLIHDIWVLFSRRASDKCHPCMPPPPTYIGWAKKNE